MELSRGCRLSKLQKHTKHQISLNHISHPSSWQYLLTVLFVVLNLSHSTFGSSADRAFQFMLPDIMPYVIHQKDSPHIYQGLEVQILQRIEREIHRTIEIFPLPTRRYISGGFSQHFDGCVYSDFLYRGLASVQQRFEIVESLFSAQMLLLSKRQSKATGVKFPSPKETLGEVGTSCDGFIQTDMKKFKIFDLKDPEQGLWMLNKDRLQYLCLSSTVFRHLQTQNKAAVIDIEVKRRLGNFEVHLLLNRELPIEEKNLLRKAVKKLKKANAFDSILEAYGVDKPR